MRKLNAAEIRQRLEVRQIANRTLTETGVTLQALADVLGRSRVAIWNLLATDGAYLHPITIDQVLAWSRHSDTQEFARRLLIELISQLDVQQLRLTDLQRYVDSPFPHHTLIAASVVRVLAERLGLTPANETNTAEVVVVDLKQAP